jgi:transposase
MMETLRYFGPTIEGADTMPRKRKEHITESLETLQALEAEHKGTPEGERVAFLRILKENPSFRHADAAKVLGRSEPTVQRWWRAYKQGGLQSALDVQKGGGHKPARLSDEGLEALKRKVHVDGVRNIKALQAFLKKEFDVEYSRAGMQYLLKAKVGEAGEVASFASEIADNAAEIKLPDLSSVDNGGSRKPVFSPSGIGIFSSEILEFLNSIPSNHDVGEWILSFRETLRRLLGDVDRISIVVNVDCDLRDPKNYHRMGTITQMLEGGSNGKPATTISTELSPSQRLYETLKQQNFPLHLYQAPEMFEYYLKQTAYIGTVFFWREKRNSPISSQTIQIIKALEPFITFLFSDIVARHKYSDRTVDSVFNASLSTMAEEVNLSEREQQVVILQLFGHTYEQIAERLFVSIETVRKHVSAIYRKTGTHSYTELFAKYFTPSLGF